MRVQGGDQGADGSLSAKENSSFLICLRKQFDTFKNASKTVMLNSSDRKILPGFTFKNFCMNDGVSKLFVFELKII